MIRLEVEGYCHKCTDFEPCLTFGDVLYMGKDREFEMIVQCKYNVRCRGISNFLREENRKEDENK